MKLSRGPYGLYRNYRVLRQHVTLSLTGNRSPVLVYQMGKVGSTAVVHALRRSEVPGPILHTHTLLPSKLASVDAAYRSQFPERRLAEHVVHGHIVRGLLDGRPPRIERFRVITLVRDPVARNASTFFQTLDLYDSGRGYARRIRAGRGAEIVDELLENFLSEFPHRQSLDWLDEEIRTVFEVDLLEEPFPWDRGWRIASGARADILLLRLEDLDDTGLRGMQTYLDAPDLRLAARNQSRAKYYADAYRLFVDRLRLPSELLDSIYGSRFASALYRPEEIERFRSIWS